MARGPSPPAGCWSSAAAFGGLLLLPTNFSYAFFAVLIFIAGAGMGLFSAPNTAAIMNSVPARQRGAASGMLATFQNSGFVLSIGVFFSLMIAGLAATLPAALTRGLTAQGVPHAVAARVADLPPVGSLFAAFLGENPVRLLLAPSGTLRRLPAANVRVLTGRGFFPQLISQPFHHGLVIVFATAMGLLVVAAGASLLRGGRYVHDEQPASSPPAGPGHPAAQASSVQASTPGPAGDAASNGQPVSSGLAAGRESGRSARRPPGRG